LFLRRRSFADEAKKRNEDGPGVIIPIGRPISDTVFYIVDPDSNPNSPILLPDGQEGELWIGGVGVAAGYLNAQTLSTERFIPDPFAINGGRVYRTGDIVKKLTGGVNAGNYVYLNRMDDQVKIGGFRIELSEIENVYISHMLVDKAIATVRDGHLIVYLKPISKKVKYGILNWFSGRAEKLKTLKPKDLLDIRKHAGRSLTYYMMPK